MIPLGVSALPHGPAMCLVQKVEALGEDSITCCCRIPVGFPWSGSGALPAYMAVEGVAQAAGLLAARPAPEEPAPEGMADGPQHGYVVRIREASFFNTDLNPQGTWTATAEMVGVSGRVVLCRGEAWQAGVQILQARFALYLGGSGQSRWKQNH